MSTTTTAPAAAGPAVAAFQPARDPLVVLLERMERLSNNVPEAGRGMSEDIAKLIEQARTPGAAQDPVFKTQLAYLLQDWPKFSGSQVTIVLSPALQAELLPLAVAFPGLESTRMQALVVGTQSLRDRELIADIRAAAAEVAGLGGGHKQLGILVSEVAKVLEHRVVVASAKTVATAATGDASATNVVPTIVGKGAAAGPEKELETPARAASTHRGGSAGEGSFSSDGVPPVRPGSEAAPAANGLSAGTNKPAGATTTAQSPSPGKTATSVNATGVLANRVTQLRQRMNEDKVTAATDAVLKAGTAAIDALEMFRTGPGREISNKLDAAARHEPGGVADVIAQMTPEGRYSGLRRELDEKLRTDPAFAAAHDDVVKFGDRYFRKRQQAQETARGAAIDYSAVDAQSQRSDAEIGEAVSRIPGREAGKSVLSELGNRAVELYNAAVQGLKALLGKDVGPESRPRPSPSPG